MVKADAACITSPSVMLPSRNFGAHNSSGTTGAICGCTTAASRSTAACCRPSGRRASRQIHRRPFVSITTDAPGLSVLSGNVTTTGAISFLDVTTATGITMTSTGAGAVNVNNATATSPAVVSTTGDVTFQGTQIGTAGTPLVFIVTPDSLTLTQQAVGFFSGPSLPGSMVFPNGSSISFNNAQIAQSFLQQQATTAASNASQAVTAAIVEEANKTFGTDSVAEDVEYGFAGEVGTTPPMDHRIDESGISVPRCVQESREGLPCK